MFSSDWGHGFFDWGQNTYCKIILLWFLCTTSLSLGLFLQQGEYKSWTHKNSNQSKFHHKFCLFSCFQLVADNVCWKKPTGICLRFVHRYLTHCYLTVLVAIGWERGSQAGAEGADSNTWLLPPNTTAHYVCVIGSGSAVWEAPAPCVLRVRAMMKSSYHALWSFWLFFFCFDAGFYPHICWETRTHWLSLTLFACL